MLLFCFLASETGLAQYSLRMLVRRSNFDGSSEPIVTIWLLGTLRNSEIMCLRVASFDPASPKTQKAPRLSLAAQTVLFTCDSSATKACRSKSFGARSGGWAKTAHLGSPSNSEFKRVVIGEASIEQKCHHMIPYFYLHAAKPPGPRTVKVAVALVVGGEQFV